MNAVFFDPLPGLDTPRKKWWGYSTTKEENKQGERMDTQIALIEMKDIQLQEGLSLVIEDHARPAEQVLGEQATERDHLGNLPAPRFVP